MRLVRQGDTETIQETVAEASERITSVVAGTDHDEVAQRVNAEGPRELVTDKGYYSRAVVSEMAEWGLRTYCSEPNRGRQRWSEQEREQQAVYASRRRIRGRARPPVFTSTWREAEALDCVSLRTRKGEIR